MKLHIAQSHGFCFGVRRAIGLANNVENNPKYLLGEIVHNKEVNNDFIQRGFSILEEPCECTPGVGVIRAHGICKDDYNQFVEKGFDLIDGTCPIVKANTKKASKGENPLIIVGKEHHPEIKYMISYIQRDYYIVDHVPDVDKLNPEIEYDLMVQTTFSTELFDEILMRLEERNIKYFKKNGICLASVRRRRAVLNLCEFCDHILIVGDNHSSNSQALKSLAASQGITSYIISRADELEAQMLDCKNLGLSSGASVSNETFEAVKNKIVELCPDCLTD